MIVSALEDRDETDELMNAVSLAKKAWARAKPDSDLYKRRQKVIASLVRKGYSWEMAKEACSTAETDM